MIEAIGIRESMPVDAELEPTTGEPNWRSRVLARLELQCRVETLSPEMATLLVHIQKSLAEDPDDEPV
jgi:hypothetical protein